MLGEANLPELARAIATVQQVEYFLGLVLVCYGVSMLLWAISAHISSRVDSNKHHNRSRRY